MNNNNFLVLCKQIPSKSEQAQYFRENGVYRYSELDKNNVLVYGEPFTKKTFNKLFIFLAPLMKANLEKTCFIENGKPVTKSKFIKEVADFHNYVGGGAKNIAIYVGSPKENLFKIYPDNDATKASALNFAYECLLQLWNEDIRTIDSGRVKWTNCGIPIVFDFHSSSAYSFR